MAYALEQMLSRPWVTLPRGESSDQVEVASSGDPSLLLESQARQCHATEGGRRPQNTSAR